MSGEEAVEIVAAAEELMAGGDKVQDESFASFADVLVLADEPVEIAAAGDMVDTAGSTKVATLDDDLSGDDVQIYSISIDDTVSIDEPHEMVATNNMVDTAGSTNVATLDDDLSGDDVQIYSVSIDDTVSIDEPDEMVATNDTSGSGKMLGEKGGDPPVDIMDDNTSKSSDVTEMEDDESGANAGNEVFNSLADVLTQEEDTEDEMNMNEHAPDCPDKTELDGVTGDPVEVVATESMVGKVDDKSDETEMENEISNSLNQAKLDEGDVAEDPVEVVATDSMLVALNKGSDDIEMNDIASDQHPETKLDRGDVSDEPVDAIATDNDVVGTTDGKSGDDNGNKEVSKCTVSTEPDGAFSDELPTEFEIDCVHSPKNCLPDNIQQHRDNFPGSPTSPNKRTPRSFSQSERQAKLHKAEVKSDFEMEQLNQQLAMTQQYANEVMEMRLEQSRLEESLKKEKEEIASRNEILQQELEQIQVSAAQIAQAEAEVASRNEKLQQELAQIQVSGAQIAQAEAEVAMLANEYHAQMQMLAQEKEQMRYNIMMMTMQHAHMINQNQVGHNVMGTMQPNMMNQFGHAAMGTMQPSAGHQMGHTPGQPVVGVHQGYTPKEMLPQVPTASHSSEEITSASSSYSHSSKVPMVECKTAGGSTKKVPMYSKGMSVYYKNTATNTETPAIIMEVHQDDLLEPFYSIRMEDGKEKQTDNGHVRLLEIGVSTKQQPVADETWGGGCGFSDSF